MSMIDRYKKKGGFVQLLNLIETTGKDKQEKFLKLIADENPAWEQEVRKKMLTMDKVLSWNATYLAEIFPRVPAVQLAMVVAGLPPEKAELFKKVLNFKERKTVEDILQDKTPNGSEISTGVMKLFAEIRKMTAEGSLKFEKFDQEMVVPENIEELLSQGRVYMSPKEIDAQIEPAPAGIPSNLADELTQLRRKLVVLTQENVKLQQDISRISADCQVFKDKLEQIKKIA